MKIIEHTADIGFEIKAKNHYEIFNKASKKILRLIFKKINIRKNNLFKKLKIKADSQEELLHNFLNEILYLIFVKKIYIKKVEIFSFEKKKNKIIAGIHGILIKNIGDYILRELKNITYHGLEIKKEKQYYTVKIIIDT